MKDNIWNVKFPTSVFIPFSKPILTLQQCDRRVTVVCQMPNTENGTVCQWYLVPPRLTETSGRTALPISSFAVLMGLLAAKKW